MDAHTIENIPFGFNGCGIFVQKNQHVSRTPPAWDILPYAVPDVKGKFRKEPDRESVRGGMVA